MMGMGSSYVRRQHLKAIQSGQRNANSEALSLRKRQRSEMQDIEDEMARLKLICEAMWELVSEVTGLTPEQLTTRIYEVDLDDGQADGRKIHALADCISCGAKIAHHSPICTFCSEPAPQRNPFAF